MVPAASTARDVSALGGAHFTPAEVGPGGKGGGGHEAPTTSPSWFRRTRVAFENSVWAPVALKLGGLALGMLALSVVGLVSILSGASGVQVPLGRALGTDLRAAWLANKPTASARAEAPLPSALGAPGGTVAAASNTPTAGAAGNSAEVPSTGAQINNPRTASASPGMTEDGKVILNLASVDDLRHLPGVGQKRADAIVALRGRLGHFKQVSDLLRVRGIGVRGLKKLMPHVVLDAPKPAA
jgi:competence protein ComEA